MKLQLLFSAALRVVLREAPRPRRRSIPDTLPEWRTTRAGAYILPPIAVGKRADLMLMAGDPSTNIGDIRNVETVFKQGVGYDPQKLINSVKGKVGIF